MFYVFLQRFSLQNGLQSLRCHRDRTMYKMFSCRLSMRISKVLHIVCHGSRVVLVSHDCVLLQDVRDYIGQISQTRSKLNVKSPVICQRLDYEQNIARGMRKRTLNLNQIEFQSIIWITVNLALLVYSKSQLEFNQPTLSYSSVWLKLN